MPPVPGPQAYFILAAFPLLVLVLFQRLPLQRALVWSVVSGYLLLPAAWVVSFRMPIIPTLDKYFIPSLAAAIFAFVLLRKSEKMKRFARQGVTGLRDNGTVLPGWLPKSPLGIGLVGFVMFSAVMTMLTNGDRLVIGSTILPGHNPREALTSILGSFVVILPILLGRKFLADDDGQKSLLTVVCLSAVIYSFLALFEVRMSPQLNVMVYGFFPHSWAQHIRNDGFRPLVFLDHGLHLGIFLCAATMMTAILFRVSEGVVRLRYLAAVLFLMGVLVLSKTLGALLIALVLLPVALLFPVRIQLMTAAVVAVITLSYPVLRGADLVPTEEILEIAEGYDTQRAGSLRGRFRNEAAILERATERPLFGWGGWGRWRVYDEAGRDITISDGEWVITIGQYGWVGYLSRFGLLCFPLIALAFNRKRHKVGLVSAGLALAIAANLIDLIPNSQPSPIIMMAAGALLGRLELGRQTAQNPKTGKAEGRQPPYRERFRPTTVGPDNPDLPDGAVAIGPTPAATRYSRFPHKTRRRD